MLARGQRRATSLALSRQQNVFCGLLLMVVGGSFAAGATHYTIGDAAHMGPGYFPLLIGALLVLQGAAIAVQSMARTTQESDGLGRVAWKPLFFVIAANLVFGALLGGLPWLGIPPMGLVAAVVALTCVASLADEAFDFKAVAVVATVLATLSYGVFIVLLRLQIALWPAFITG